MTADSVDDHDGAEVCGLYTVVVLAPEAGVDVGPVPRAFRRESSIVRLEGTDMALVSRVQIVHVDEAEMRVVCAVTVWPALDDDASTHALRARLPELAASLRTLFTTWRPERGAIMDVGAALVDRVVTWDWMSFAEIRSPSKCWDEEVLTPRMQAELHGFASMIAALATVRFATNIPVRNELRELGAKLLAAAG